MGFAIHARMKNTDNFNLIGFLLSIKYEVFADRKLAIAGEDFATVSPNERIGHQIVKALVEQS
jgi:hypothetical protein